MSFVCACCGKIHEERPAYAFQAPDPYLELSEEERNLYQAELSRDFCIIHYPDQTDYFIRARLEIPIIDDCEPLEYGVWVSLSEQNFMDYQANFAAEHFEEKHYFAWLCNGLPEYEWAQIPFKAQTQPDGFRPIIYPKPDFEHKLVSDYYQGITQEEAAKRIHKWLARFRQPEK